MIEADIEGLTYKPTRKQVARLAQLAAEVEPDWERISEDWTLVSVPTPSRPWHGMVYASIVGWGNRGGSQVATEYQWLLDANGDIVASTTEPN
jgi:hypothetical protein